MPAPAELSADETDSATDEAFDDFPNEDEVEGAVDADEEDSGDLDTGGEQLDDAGEDDGSASNGTDEGAEARVDSGPKGEQKRDTATGKFKGEAKEPTDEEKAVEAAKPKWEPFAVSVDRKSVAIPEAVLSKVNGHHMLAIKDADFPRFQQRIQRGALADSMWRGLNEAVAEMEEQRAIDAEGPKSKSDAEIEASTILEYLQEKVELEDGTVTTRMALAVPTKRELDWLADRVARRQLEHKNTFATERKTFVDKRAEERAAASAQNDEPEAQLRGLAALVMDMADEQSEFPQEVKDLFKGVTEAEMKAIYGDLMPIRRSVFWKEGKDWFSNTELILSTAKASLAKLRAATPGKKPGTPAAGSKTRRAEQLNKGSNSTSLKSRRAPLNPGKSGTPGKRSEEPRETAHSKAGAAEAKYRQTTRQFLNSPDFDIPDDGDE